VLTTKILTEDYKIPECGKPSNFMGERQSSALVLLKNSSRSGIINESLHKLRGLVIRYSFQGSLHISKKGNIIKYDQDIEKRR